MEQQINKEEMDKSKTELLNQLKEMNISSDNLDWVTEQLDQTINEEVERQTDKNGKPLTYWGGVDFTNKNANNIKSDSTTSSQIKKTI